MSIFKDATSWPDKYKGCGAPHQSPINLSRSFALPCDRLCELVVDKVAIQKGFVSVNNEGVLKLGFAPGTKPTVRFNGEGYTCVDFSLFHPAQHTIENVQAEAELVGYFTNPKGYLLAISVAVRPSAGETNSTSFFNKFVPYVVPGESINVVLGDSWEFNDVLPSNPAYFVYEGTKLTPNCDPDVTWVVFANAVTIDPSDFAKLSSSTPAGSRPIQPVDDRQVFYNDGETIEGPAAQKDGKVYMRCRRVPREGEISSSDAKAAVRQSNLIQKQQELTDKNRTQAMSNMETKMKDAYASLGGIWGVLSVLTFAGIAFYLFSSSGASVARALFSVLMMVPAYINRYTFALLWG